MKTLWPILFLYFGCAVTPGYQPHPTLAGIINLRAASKLKPDAMVGLQHQIGVQWFSVSVQWTWNYVPNPGYAGLPVAFNFWESTDPSQPMDQWNLIGTTTDTTFTTTSNNPWDFYRVSSFFPQPSNNGADIFTFDALAASAVTLTNNTFTSLSIAPRSAPYPK